MADTPNVLFLFPDQHRHDWIGANDDVPVRTPNLDDLADRGVRFTNAICPSPLCAPCRTNLLSGLDFDAITTERGSGTAGMDYHTYTGRSGPSPVDDHPTYPRLLRDQAGVHMAGCGKFLDKQSYVDVDGLSGTHPESAAVDYFGYSDAIKGAGKWVDYGTPGEPEHLYQEQLEQAGLAAAHYEDTHDRDAMTGTHPSVLPDEWYLDNWIGRNALTLLDRVPDDRPWHLKVSFAGPHSPMAVTEEMHGWYRDPDVDFPDPVDGDTAVDPDKHQDIRRNYAAMIENIDRWLGRYLDHLDDRGELENTIIVYASDHGEMLGDHQRWRKRSPFQPSLGVPLVAAGPGIEDRDPVDAPATILDLYATFLDFAGVDPPADIDSRSLRPILSGAADAIRDAVTAGLGPWRAAFDGRYKLITGFDPVMRDEWHQWRGGRDQHQAFVDGDRTLDEITVDRDPVLYDLDADPNETENVADRHPNVVAALATHLPVEVAA
jgi:arylsulfatase A-like enzyme